LIKKLVKLFLYPRLKQGLHHRKSSQNQQYIADLNRKQQYKHSKTTYRHNIAVSYDSISFLWIFVKNRQSITVMNKQRLGNSIKERRKFLKITQEDLADIAGVSERTLRSIEKGEANPEMDSLLKICEVLGLSVKIEVIK
jgi:y4mF family transcriptional regulator